MQDINALRLFEEGRLNPWKPNDKIIIDAHLAMFGVTDPQQAVAMTKVYADKLEAYMAKQPKVVKVEIKEEKVEEVKPKKAKLLSSPKKDV
jgi:hypothetical protein